MSKKTRECLLCFRIKNVIKKGSKKEKKKKRIKIVKKKKRNDIIIEKIRHLPMKWAIENPLTSVWTFPAPDSPSVVPMTSKASTRHVASSHRPTAHTQSRPRRRCLPGQSTSGCTTRICRVNASLREKVFSSVHR